MPEAFERQTAQYGKAGIQIAEYTHEHTSTETRSVHHFMFTLLQDVLSERNDWKR